MDELIDQICASQSVGGAYIAQVRLPFGDVEDLNCFVTALVLRETAGIAGGPRLADSRRRACGFLLRGTYPAYRDLWAFYPHDRHPFWMPQALYADADDTAITLLTLVREGLQSHACIAAVATHTLSQYRATGPLARHIANEWERDGVFLTWLTTAAIANPIDCCVNTNVIALLAYADLTAMDGYAAACAMINEAAERVAAGRVPLAAVTPFYPHPLEWYHAVVHAVSMGATALEPARDALAEMPMVSASLTRSTTLPLCSSPDGQVIWRAPVLHAARRLKQCVESKEGKR